MQKNVTSATTKILRLHLSTVIILFLIASLFLGLQFVARELPPPQPIAKNGFMIYGTQLMDYYDYGFPFTVYSTRPPKRYSPSSDQWNHTAIALNALTALAFLATAGFLSESIFRNLRARERE